METFGQIEDKMEERRTRNHGNEERHIPITHSSPRHSLVEEGKPCVVTRPVAKTVPVVVELPIIPDANTLKRKLHNLFISGPSLRSRQSDGGSLGSAASASPVSTGSPSDWSNTDISAGVGTGAFFGSSTTGGGEGGGRPTSRDITLEEELAEKVNHMGEVARGWQNKWRLEREDTLRLSDHLAKCESESKRLLESLNSAYSKKVKMLEDLLLKARRTTELVMVERAQLEDRLKQSKEIIDLQRREIEKEFSRARQDVDLLRSEVGGMQERTMRLEKENKELRKDKELLANDLRVFTGNAKNFNTSLQEAEVRGDLYHALFDIALHKLKALEESRGQHPAVPKSHTRGRYKLHVDAKNPTLMHVEDVMETTLNRHHSINEDKVITNINESYRKDLRHMSPSNQVLSVSTENVGRLNHDSRSSTPSSTSTIDKHDTPPSSKLKYDKSSKDRHQYTTITEQFLTVEEKGKTGKKPRRFSFGKDSMKPSRIIKQLSGGSKSEGGGSPKDRQLKHSPERAIHNLLTPKVIKVTPSSVATNLNDDVIMWDIDDDDEDMIFSETVQVVKPTEQRLRSFSDSEDINILIDTCPDIETAKVMSHQGTQFLEVDQTIFRLRRNTMDGRIEKPNKDTSRLTPARDFPSSSNEELQNHKLSGYDPSKSHRNGMSNEQTTEKIIPVKKTKNMDFSDLLRVFLPDKESPSREVRKGSTKRKGKFTK